MQQLSELDAAFLYLETDTAPMHIGAIYLFDGQERDKPFAYSAFVAYLRSRLHVVPLFRQRLKSIPLRLGRPYWVDDTEFSIERHLAYVSLGGNGNRDSLMSLASRVLEQPLKRDRPLWHITFVDGLNESDPEIGPRGFALIVRLHHAAIDAFSGEEIMAKLLEYSPTARPIPAPIPWNPQQPPSDERVMIQAGANLARRPFRVATLAANAAGATARGLIQRRIQSLPLPVPLFSAPKSPFNQPISSERQILARTFELSRLKAIKATLGDVTLNDVVLGVCAELLIRYLKKQNAVPKQPLVAMTPVSVRSRSLRRATGNQMSAMLLGLATDEPNPARRIWNIHWNAVASEPYQEAIAADRLTELVPSTMLALSARLYTELQLSQRYQPVFNIPITNVPGPQVPMFLQGARMTRQYNTAPLFDSMGMVIVAVSYQGEITFNFTVCPSVMPYAKELPQLLEESLEAIEKAAERLSPDDLEQAAYRADPGEEWTEQALGMLEDVVKGAVSKFRKS